eukprot:scaffold5478_cov63-Phaeocystis_antarctica.AAC.7
MPPPSMTHEYRSPVSRRSSCSRSSAMDRQTLKRRSERRSRRRDLMHASCIAVWYRARAAGDKFGGIIRLRYECRCRAPLPNTPVQLYSATTLRECQASLLMLIYQHLPQAHSPMAFSSDSRCCVKFNVYG